MRYTEGQRWEAIGLAQELGDVAEAARQLGHPRQTVHRWLRDAGVTVTNEKNRGAADAARERWEARRAVMADELGEVAAKALECCDDALDGADVRTAKDAALTMAVLIDKAQLLSGGATGRVYVPPERVGEVIGDARTRGLSLVTGTD